LRDGLVAREHEAARVAAGVRHVEQLEVRDDVLVEDRDVLEVLEQVEDDVRLELLDAGADDAEVCADPELADLVAEVAERPYDVKLGLPLDGLEVRIAR